MGGDFKEENTENTKAARVRMNLNRIRTYCYNFITEKCAEEKEENPGSIEK